ncbi:hypothetical protein D8674_042009 [Pyrus ussuriensis x Pyrus communis]|uniref:Rubredoxin-like domain-containing protein n=1 Tax=Pyrus ussuriensis x Pyrus communis TaxID=2448454 RepID=A0A5N5G9S3_9ROSA|nr:hypothetical protein D8674_042009 [Pyrus ussuriensis x Pyrus communis]
MMIVAVNRVGMVGASFEERSRSKNDCDKKRESRGEMEAVLAAASSSSSCSAAFKRHHSTRTPQLTTPRQLAPNQCQKTSFQGLSLGEAKKGVFDSLLVAAGNNRSGLGNYNVGKGRGLRVTARTTGASKSIEAEVDKPLGLTLGQKPGAVDGGGNAARAGLKAGDQVLYTSSFFGDELWPADKLGFTKTAINAKPDSLLTGGATVDVKRLPKATHIYLDYGFICTLQKPFDEQPDAYACPQCLAPKTRFARYDVNTGKAIGGCLPPIAVIIGLVAGLAGVGALLVYGLQ